MNLEFFYGKDKYKIALFSSEISQKSNTLI